MIAVARAMDSAHARNMAVVAIRPAVIRNGEVTVELVATADGRAVSFPDDLSGGEETGALPSSR